MKKYLGLCLWTLYVLWHIETIRPTHRLMLWFKSLRLFASFLAFTDRERPKRQLRAAMVGAELSAVYDFDTDVVPINHPSESIYLDHLQRYVPDTRVRALAQQLFEMDLSGKLSPDGLERGSIALTFYNGMIESHWLSVYTPGDINYFGEQLQIIDDALDLVKDRENGDKNCLLRGQRHIYLAEAERFVQGPFFARLEDNSRVYRYLRHKWSKVDDGMRIHRKGSATMRTDTRSPFDAHAASMVMSEVKAHMLATRPEKYKPWFAGVEMFRSIARAAEKCSSFPGFAYFEDGEKRAEGTDAVYSAAHYADDVADGDAAVPAGFTSAVEYVNHLMRVVAGLKEPCEAGGRLLVYGLSLLQETGADLRDNILDILTTLHFDAVRRGSGRLLVFDAKEIEHQCDLRDRNGTIGGCLKVTRESNVQIADIDPLGRSTQIRYTIRDLRHDILTCMLNIPREDVRRLGIYIPDHTSEVAVRAWSDSLPVRRWCREQAELGVQFLDDYRARKSELRMHPFTRSILHFMYERKTDVYLRQIPQAA